MPADYYDVLGVGRNASSDEIKKSYKKLAIKYHPDKTQDKSHHQKFLLVQEAYDALKDEESRQKYHREAGISTASRPGSGFPGARSSTGFATSSGFGYATNYTSFSRSQHTRSSYADAPFGSSFFDIYQRSSKMYADPFSRGSRHAQEEAAREHRQSEEKAARYAEFARRKMEEDKVRRQEEYLRKAHKLREEEELRQQMEEKLRAQKEERMRAQAAAQAEKADQETFAKSRGFGDAKSEYEQAKMAAHRRAREAEAYQENLASRDFHDTSNSRRGSNSSDAIIVEDEELESDGEMNEDENDNDNESESENENETGHVHDAEDVNNESDEIGEFPRENSSGFSHVKAEQQDTDYYSTRERSYTPVEYDTGKANSIHHRYRRTPGTVDPEEGDASDSSESTNLSVNSYGLHGDPQKDTEDDVSASAINDPGSVPPSEYPDEHTNASFASEGTASGTPNIAKHQPEVVEVPEESDYDHDATSEYIGGDSKSRSSPRTTQGPERIRTHSQTFPRRSGAEFNDSFNEGSFGPKKPRLANYDGMKSSLHTFFEDVDFSDIRDTLPNLSHRTRKASSSTTAQAPKRARYAEYTDGTSSAETLYTPVNKAYTRNSSGSISTSDLSPNMDDSALLFSVDPPSIKVRQDTKKNEWDAYITEIQEYKQKFAEYRKAVLEFQMGRLAKDERHQNIIYSDTSCLDVYQSCLFNDILLLQNYTRALQDFRSTLKTFSVNCETVNKMKG
ncbi:hypothetical protein JCM33374_g2063 [Metschnikowia sp. JCM 33374]|nr:hypothetical protein JCM33374_g2063 [Metschnikowia sp. JCM 33374]